MGRGRLDHAPLQALPLLRTVYTGWRLNSLTISLEICYCSLLKGTDRRHFGRWMAPPQGITMKDSASGALPPTPRVLPVHLGRRKSRHSHSLTLRHLKNIFSFIACHVSSTGGWKLAEGIPRHEAPDLSITFQLANEPQRQGSLCSK